MHGPLAALAAAALVVASGIADAQTAPQSAQQRDRGTILTFTCVPVDDPAAPLEVNVEPVRQIVYYGHTLARYREDGAKVVWSARAGDQTGWLDLATLQATIDDKALRCRPKARKF